MRGRSWRMFLSANSRVLSRPGVGIGWRQSACCWCRNEWCGVGVGELCSVKAGDLQGFGSMKS